MTQSRARYSAGPSEHEEQAAVIDWSKLQSAAVPELKLLHAIPNGAHKSKAAAVKFKAEGLKPGVPDLCLPVARNGYHALYIEMKVKNRKPRKNQEWWLDKLQEQGNLAVVCWSADEAIEVISEYLGLGR